MQTIKRRLTFLETIPETASLDGQIDDEAANSRPSSCSPMFEVGRPSCLMRSVSCTAYTLKALGLMRFLLLSKKSKGSQEHVKAPRMDR
jgi:hypothetical protein